MECTSTARGRSGEKRDDEFKEKKGCGARCLGFNVKEGKAETCPNNPKSHNWAVMAELGVLKEMLERSFTCSSSLDVEKN